MSPTARIAFVLGAIALLDAGSNGARGDEEGRRLKVFYAPLLAAQPGFKAAAGKLKNGSFPTVPNHFADCLPGKLYDIRLLLERSMKGRLGKGDFAVFNPESKICVVYAPAGVFDFVDDLEESYSSPAPNVAVKGAISIGKDADGSNPGADLASWRVSGQSGCIARCSSDNDHGIRYDLDCESMVKEDGKTLALFYTMNIVYGGVKYGSKGHGKNANAFAAADAPVFDPVPAPNVTLISGKRETIKLGETPEGKGVYLHITAEVELGAPVSRFAGREAKRKLTGSIENHLEEQAAAMEGGKLK